MRYIRQYWLYGTVRYAVTRIGLAGTEGVLAGSSFETLLLPDSDVNEYCSRWGNCVV